MEMESSIITLMFLAELERAKQGLEDAKAIIEELKKENEELKQKIELGMC